ncbi:MAG: paraquat-inducible protein A [Campylobacterales bacterium]
MTKITACPECGVIVEFRRMDTQIEYRCPRCNATIYRPGQPFIFSIVMAISALIFFFVTIGLDFITLTILGEPHTVSVVDALFFIFEEGHYIVAFLVLSVGIIIPVTLLFLMLLMLIPLSFRVKPYFFIDFYRMYGALKSWAMADVYILAVMVSLIKIFGLGDVELGYGLYVFILFLVCFYTAYLWFNPYDIWYKYEVDKRFRSRQNTLS